MFSRRMNATSQTPTSGHTAQEPRVCGGTRDTKSRFILATSLECGSCHLCLMNETQGLGKGRSVWSGIWTSLPSSTAVFLSPLLPKPLPLGAPELLVSVPRPLLGLSQGQGNRDRLPFRCTRSCGFEWLPGLFEKASASGAEGPVGSAHCLIPVADLLFLLLLGLRLPAPERLCPVCCTLQAA